MVEHKPDLRAPGVYEVGDSGSLYLRSHIKVPWAIYLVKVDLNFNLSPDYGTFGRLRFESGTGVPPIAKVLKKRGHVILVEVAATDRRFVTRLLGGDWDAIRSW